MILGHMWGGGEKGHSWSEYYTEYNDSLFQEVGYISREEGQGELVGNLPVNVLLEEGEEGEVQPRPLCVLTLVNKDKRCRDRDNFYLNLPIKYADSDSNDTYSHCIVIYFTDKNFGFGTIFLVCLRLDRIIACKYWFFLNNFARQMLVMQFPD